MAINRSQRRIEREKFYKRGSSWTRKGDELVKITGADLYWVMHRNGKFYVYSSTDRPGWPPTKEEIAKHYPLPTYRSPADFPPMNRQAEDKGEKEETSIMPEMKDSIEFRDYTVAPVHKRRVFSIPKPPVLRRSPIGTRSGARRIKS